MSQQSLALPDSVESVFDVRDIAPLDLGGQIVAPELLPPGAVPGHSKGSFCLPMTNAQYHSQRSFISHSGMIELLRSPAHYFEYLINPREESSPSVWTAIHAAVLEPEEYAKQYISYDGHRRGKAWDEFKAAHASHQILTASEVRVIEGATASVREFSDFPLWPAIRAGEPEKSIFWTDEKSGARCRIRIDCLTPHVIFDLKSIDDARPEKVQRQIAHMDYDLQAYMYTAGTRAFTGKTLPFYFIFVESKRPHGLCLVRAGQSVLANGFIKFRRGVQRFAELCASGDWSCYPGSVYTAEMPRYAMLTPENDGELYEADV